MGTRHSNIFPIPVCSHQSASCRDTTDSLVAPVGGSTFQWTVDLSGQGGNPYFDLKDGHTFFFEIFNEGTSDGFESQYINITSNAAASTTTSSATQSPTSKSTSPPTSSTTQTSPAANTNTPTAKSTGLSKGAQAGIGVGVGVVGLALIIGAIFFFLARRRRAADTGYSSAPMELPPNEVAKSYYGPPVELAPGVPKYAGQQPRPMSELPETPNMSAVSGLHEL